MSPLDSSQSSVVALKPGDVLRYVPMTNHCREGIAIVTENGCAVDTYWRAEGDGQSHVLTPQELATGEFSFSVHDYEALDRYSSASHRFWKTHHPRDRARISSQHGLQEVLYLRCGARPDLDTQIENAREQVAKAESDLRTAEWRLEGRRRDLGGLEDQR